MKTNLNNNWLLDFSEHKSLNCNIPCSMYSVLLDHHIIKDPAYGKNEYAAMELSRFGSIWTKFFSFDEAELNKRVHYIVFKGIDTLGRIYLNNHFLGSVNNMHRIWEFEVTGYLNVGENELRVELDSPLIAADEANAKYPLWGVDTTYAGYQHIRKSHHMYGWDWGPKLPDMGLYRDVELQSIDKGRIKDVYVRQQHNSGKVQLSIQVENELLVEALEIKLTLTAPDGEMQFLVLPASSLTTAHLQVSNPQLWWPHNLGDQPLYTLKAELLDHQQSVSSHSQRIGLRTLTISTDIDQWGQEFCFVINDKKIFSMGADYIPEDNILSQCTKERTEKLIRDCIFANYNSIRVWGGGYYPEDWFYNLCDQYGLIVWQDFMFACATYLLDDAFEQNITAEFIDNIKRFRNHACLGLFCGNNEMEWAWMEWGLPENKRLLQDYTTMFERLLPQICGQYAPDTFYWPASPSSGGGFSKPNDQDRGDVHFWEVWHSGKPFEEYRKYYFRYCSEFGFESYPHLETIKSFAEPKDLNAFSAVMESHQKCDNGNRIILNYLADNYLYPTSFEKLVYASQLLQADAIKYGVEHFRRYRERCRGAIYWQLNDCWPCISWASIDYFGRYKALHYAARRFFAPVLLSAHEDGYNITLNVSNEMLTPFKGTVSLTVCDHAFQEYHHEECHVSINELASLDCLQRNLEPYLKGYERERYIRYTLKSHNGDVLSSGSLILCKPKHFNFLKPQIDYIVNENESELSITVSSDVFTKGVYIDVEKYDVHLSDNYFDISRKEPVEVRVVSNTDSKITKDDLERNLKIMSVYDIGE